MKTLRRYDLKNTDYFITSVAFKRRKILLNDISIFWESWDKIQPSAWVVMPDHFHVIVNSGAYGISKLMHRARIKYSRLYRDKFGPGRVWQNRFWDHVIRNQEDMNRHLDYIHYNPVKHGITSDPFLHQCSSLNEYLAKGFYSRDWGVIEDIDWEGDFGE